MVSAPDAARPAPYGIGGWLLLYVVLTAGGLLAFLHELWQNLELMRALPSMRIALGGDSLITLLWVLCYGLALFHLVLLRRGAAKLVRKMIAASPFFALLRPVLFVVLTVLTVPNTGFRQMFDATFTAQTAGSLLGTFIMALVWYRYFSVSARVKKTWPEAIK